MYIKGSKIFLFCTLLLLAVFIIYPSSVNAYIDAPASCPSGTTSKSNGACCPTNENIKNSIKSSNPTYETINLLGEVLVDSSVGLPLCTAKYTAVTKTGSITNQQTFTTAIVSATFVCPANTCSSSNFGKTICLGYKEQGINYKNDKLICCAEDGQKGSLVKEGTCNPKNAPKSGSGISANFTDSFKPISVPEICEKDSGKNNKDDKRSTGEKEKIYGSCVSCLNSGKLWTALGCIELTSKGIITSILRVFYGIITFFMILKLIIAGYNYQTGDPEKLKDSKSEIIATISAAVTLNLGIILLRYLSIDILGLGDLLGNVLPILQ